MPRVQLLHFHVLAVTIYCIWQIGSFVDTALPSRDAMNVTSPYQPPTWLDFQQSSMSPLWALFTIVSGLWLLYRVIRVFQKPASEIDELLGHDIPPQPEIALANVGSDSITLYWKSPDNYHTPMTNSVAVNGVSAVEVDTSETAVMVGELVPGHHYKIRAISTNNAGYTSYSRLIQVQTIPEDGHRAVKLLSATEPGSGKRPSTGGRRVSAPFGDNEKEVSRRSETALLDDNDGDNSLPKLNQKLDALREQQEELEQQLLQETEDAETTRISLVEERDRLKKQLDENEKSHSESRKHLKDLEQSSKAAQRKKSAKERDLQKKKSERQKMKEEIAQWESERETLQQQTAKLRQDLEIEKERQHCREADAKKVIEEAQGRGKSHEDEIQKWGTSVKLLEDERRLEGERQEEEEAEADRLEKEEENRFTNSIQELEQKFMKVQRLIQAIDPELEEARRRQPSDPRYAPGPSNNYASAYGVPRSARGSISQGISSIPHTSAGYSNALPASMPRIPGSSPFTSNRVPYAFAPSASPTDIDALTGGAMMSPTVDGLLPTDLFKDDADQTIRPQSQQPNPVMGLFDQHRDPQSPASQHSGARNLLPSPTDDHASMHSGSFASSMDIGRAMSSLSEAAPKRSIFGGLVGRRNAPTSSNEIPGLSTLTQGESTSFGLEDLVQSESSRGHQRNISTMTNPFSNVMSGGSVDDFQASPPPAVRKPRFLSRKQVEKEPFYNLDRQASPRPTSTYSYDHQLLPSTDNASLNPFANSSGIDLLRQRNSPLGHDWSSMNEHSFSANPSRRPSIQYGSTGNLSLNSSVLPKDGRHPAAVAPIGSGRPGKSKAKKLNPNAQSFVYNMFNRSESKKTPKTDKNTWSDSGPSRHSVDFDPEVLLGDSSPVSRQSRDGGASMLTTTTDSHESVGGDSLQSGDFAGSTPSTSTPKDNLLSRLTRKTSSSKFTTPWSKDKKDKGHNRRKSTEVPSTPSELGEDGGDYLGQSYGSTHGSTYGSNLGTPIEGKFEDKMDEGKDKGKEKAKSAARGSLSSSWSKMMGGKRKKENTAMSETSESRDEDE